MGGSLVTHRHGAEEVFESSIPGYTGSKKIPWTTWSGLSFWDLEAHVQVTEFLQLNCLLWQGYTSWWPVGAIFIQSTMAGNSIIESVIFINFQTVIEILEQMEGKGRMANKPDPTWWPSEAGLGLTLKTSISMRREVKGGKDATLYPGYGITSLYGELKHNKMNFSEFGKW